MERIDALIVGGGVVGLALAARLARPGRAVVLAERHPRWGLESSSRNSEVLHAGFYYPAGSLKARLCVAGRRALESLCAAYGVGYRRTGKLVVAADPSGVPRLEALLARGRENGVEGLELLDGAGLRRRAPEVAGAAALWSAATGIVDTEGVMSVFKAQAEDRGALCVWGCRLEAAEPRDGGYLARLSGQSEPLWARRVINAAGLHADRVAALPGLDPAAAGYRLHWFKGEYFALRRPLPLDTLVYPLPEAHGLGIHLTVDLRGQQRLGPNAFPARSLDYAVDPAHAAEFYEAAGRFLPRLRLEDLAPGGAGIRPKLAADGSFRDFVIAEESARGLPGWVNLIGIESPGFTASPAIADLVADLLEWPK